MLISAYGFKGGFRDALAAIAGTQTGNTLWFVICVTGLGALVTASPLVFHAIRLLGAAYLVWLGVGALWKSWHAAPDDQGPKLMGRPYVQATLTQMGNPKAILFFGALVPQFLDTRAGLIPQYLIMFAITFIGESIILTAYGALAAYGGADGSAPRRLARAHQRAGAAGAGRGGGTVQRMTPDQFITTNAALMAPPLVPEIKLYLATEVVPLWRATEEELEKMGVPPPYWAFAWAGGQALARYILDHPEQIAGKHVLDIGAGSGLVAIAAAKAGAASRAGRGHRCLFRRRHRAERRSQWLRGRRHPG